MNDLLKRKLYRLAIIAVVFGLVWAAERYGLVDGERSAPKAADSSSTQPAAPSAKQPANEPPAKADKPTDSANPTKKPDAKPPGTSPAATKLPAASNPFLMKSLSLRDQNGRTIYTGDIDLKPTIDRISAGKTLRFPHDGTTFQNRESKLPRQAPGYYREWVVPTPDEDGPGPQRLVTGDGGDVWYTHDHYRSFLRIPVKLELR